MPALHPLTRLVRRRLKAFAPHVPAALTGDAKALHRARVASRRLREVLPILAPTGTAPDLNRTRKTFRRVTRALGKVRELDVALALLDEARFQGSPAPAARLVRARIARDRVARRRAMNARVLQLDWVGATQHVQQVTQSMITPGRERRWRAALAKRLARRAAALREAVRAAGALYAPEALHGARVATKKLRYALELANETGAAPCRGEVRALKRLQETLGRLHDLQVLGVSVRDTDVRAPRHQPGQARSITALEQAIDDECRILHGRYLRLARGVDPLCHRVVREFVPAIRASAVSVVRARPVQMQLAEPEPLRVAEGGF